MARQQRVIEDSSTSFDGLTDQDLLQQYVNIMDQLKSRGITRTDNIPTGDYAEKLACKAFRLEPTGRSFKGYDAIGEDGTRYQIKARRADGQIGSKPLGIIGDLEEDQFDYLLAIIFTHEYFVRVAYLIPRKVVRKCARRIERLNGWRIYLREPMLSERGVREITKEISKASKYLITEAQYPQKAPSPASQLARYIRSLEDFKMVGGTRCYNHMGATITDTMLQAGQRYDTVVVPRVERVQTYRSARTTKGFLRLLERKGPKVVLDWRDDEKPARVLNITRFFVKEGISTEDDLRIWLEDEENIKKLKKQRGIGPKTLDYLKMLVEMPTVAVDRHLVNFLGMAGMKWSGYEEARELIKEAAVELGKRESALDNSIWYYMSNKSIRGSRKS
jgi:hypothetical protein